VESLGVLWLLDAQIGRRSGPPSNLNAEKTYGSLTECSRA